MQCNEPLTARATKRFLIAYGLRIQWHLGGLSRQVGPCEVMDVGCDDRCLDLAAVVRGVFLGSGEVPTTMNSHALETIDTLKVSSGAG